MPEKRKLLEPEYLGDAVYVHDQGSQLALAVNHHENKVIYLEPEIIKALISYAKRAQFIER